MKWFIHISNYFTQRFIKPKHTNEGYTEWVLFSPGPWKEFKGQLSIQHGALNRCDGAYYTSLLFTFLLELCEPFILWNLPASGIFYKFLALQVFLNTSKHHFSGSMTTNVSPKIKKNKCMKRKLVTLPHYLEQSVFCSITWKDIRVWVGGQQPILQRLTFPVTSLSGTPEEWVSSSPFMHFNSILEWKCYVTWDLS